MARRTDFQAAKTYTGQAIKKACTISLKIDGVRILSRDGTYVTRNDKVPAGLFTALTADALAKISKYGDCEIYRHGMSFGDINGMLARHNPMPNFFVTDDIYPLVELDPRLYISTKDGLKKNDVGIQSIMNTAVSQGYEGLVIQTEGHWYRVKPEATADVIITGYFEQQDKHKAFKGCLGGFDTNWGKVTAFTQELREELWVNPEQHVGKLMQVTYKERYPKSGKFRYCTTFNHFVADKDWESFDTPIPS